MTELVVHNTYDVVLVVGNDQKQRSVSADSIEEAIAKAKAFALQEFLGSYTPRFGMDEPPDDVPISVVKVEEVGTIIV